MRGKDWFLALCVVVIWGVNFVVIKVGVAEIPPLMLGALRFLLVVFPAAFFVPRPKIPFRLLFLYGLTISFGQFAFLFCAIKVGMPAGLASLVLQAQAFFTLLLCAIFMQEPLRLRHFCGMLIAALGIILIARGGLLTQNPGHLSLLGFVLTLLAALCWATGNMLNKIIAREAPGSSPLGLVIWSAFLPLLAFCAASVLLEGQQQITSAILHFSWRSFFSVIYLSGASSLLGYSVWSSLMARYETWRVAPLSLLVPVVGLIAAWLLLDEELAWIQILGALLVMLGLMVNLFLPAVRQWMHNRRVVQ